MTAKRTPRLSRLLSATVAIALVALIAACARIPLSGPVMEGQEVEDSDPPGIQVLPNSPTPGASPESIVRGFLDAGTGTQGNYATARSYLAEDLAASWDPTERVLVHDGAATMTLISPTTVRVEVAVVGEVDATGAYESYATPQQQSLDFEVENDSGEWRVSEAQSGLVLMSERFDQVFEPFTLYFFDSTYRYLVPDVRWFPHHTTAPTRIVQAILEGPVTWLSEGNIRSAFPTDTTLRGPVTTEGGVAHADFSQEISSASNDLFSLMLLQVRESLLNVGVVDIEEVQLSANGAPLDITPPPDGAVQSHTQVNATPLVYREGQIGYLSGDTLTPPTGSERLAAILPNLDASRGTVSVDQGLGAFLTPNGIMAIPFSTGQPVSLDARDGLAAPSIDPFGFVWTASALDDDVRVSNPSRQFTESFELGSLGSQGLLSLQVSRDGARVAALVRDGGGVQLVVAAIERSDGAGDPTGIGEPVEIPLGSGSPLELTWVDETSVAVLVDDGQGSSMVRVQRIGGEAQDRGAVEHGVQIAGSNTLAGLRVVDVDGNLFVPRGGNRWQAQGTRIDFLVTQA